VWVKIGDFGLAKSVKGDTMLRTDISGFYTAPEAMGMSNSSETSEYTNAVDIWSLGCISHKMLTQVMPFSRLCILFEYYERRVEFPRTIMLSKNIGTQGIGFVERMLASVPSSRPTAEEALGHEWLLADDEEAMEPDNEVPTDQIMPDRPATLDTGTLGGTLLPYTRGEMKAGTSTEDVLPILCPFLRSDENIGLLTKRTKLSEKVAQISPIGKAFLP
jgi:serine/threonine protein kinase